MIRKRFTVCHEQNDINGWTMSIVDWQTKEPFDYTTYEVHSSSITDTKDEMEDLCLLLNELHDENKELEEVNEQLKQQKEVWKRNCCTNSNFNSILLHELDIAREQGFEVSNPFKQFLEDRGDAE